MHAPGPVSARLGSAYHCHPCPYYTYVIAELQSRKVIDRVSGLAEARLMTTMRRNAVKDQMFDLGFDGGM